MGKAISNGKLAIGYEYIGVRKKPCIVIQEGNTSYILGMFSNEEKAKFFIEKLAELTVEENDILANEDGYIATMCEQAGYKKAIDDFIHECDKYCGFYSGKNKNITREDMLKIAEHLKAGGTK